MKKIFSTGIKYAGSHKLISTIVVIAVVGGGYYWYKISTKASTTPQYTIARARMGSIIQSVTGTGQVSAQNQLDVKSVVSGNITAIKVAVGDHVRTGDLLATVDSPQAALDLANARISYAKLVQPAKTADVSAAENALAKSYSDGYSAVSGVFLDLPGMLAGTKDMLYNKDGYLSAQQSTYLTSTGQEYRKIFASRYDNLVIEYATVLQEYKDLNRSSATSSIDALIAHTYTLAKDAAAMLQAGQNAVNFVSTSQPDYQAKVAATAATNITSWSSQANTNVSSVLAAQSSIQNNTSNLQTLRTGADDLDIQSQRISLTQKEQTYANYFIRAPFDGVVGRIPVNVYDQASGATIATIIGDNKIATISLNEVDAAKVQTGQSATITFDAIDGLTATGTVSQVDLVGTVTQGVVTYTVKIAINSQDSRIKPGMSVNTTIITKQKENVLMVASSAIKTQGQRQYVQIFANPTLPSMASSTRTRFASTTSDFASSPFASSTSGFRSGTGGQGASITITSATAPENQNVVIGDADDTSTEIVSGLTPGQWVVTKTVTTGQTSTTAAPSILNSFGGNRTGAGGAARTLGR